MSTAVHKRTLIRWRVLLGVYILVLILWFERWGVSWGELGCERGCETGSIPLTEELRSIKLEVGR